MLTIFSLFFIFEQDKTTSCYLSIPEIEQEQDPVVTGHGFESGGKSGLKDEESEDAGLIVKNRL